MKRDKQSVINAEFLEARAALLDVASFLDRVSRSEGEDDFRIEALMSSISLLSQCSKDRTRALLESLSYEGGEAQDSVRTKGACGAPKPLEK